MPVPAVELGLAMAIIAVAAFLQGIVGIGFNVVSVPILLMMDPVLAPVPNLLMAVPLVLSQMLREQSDIDWAGVKWILVGRAPGGLAGLGLLLVLSSMALDITLAVMILTIVGLLASGVSIARSPATEFTAGVFSGMAGIIGAVGGPPVGLLYKDDAGPVIRSTLGAVFAVGLMISIGLRMIGGQITLVDLQVALWLLPAMTIGFVASSRIKDRIEGPWVRRGILAISSVAAATLLLRTVMG